MSASTLRQELAKLERGTDARVDAEIERLRELEHGGERTARELEAHRGAGWRHRALARALRFLSRRMRTRRERLEAARLEVLREAWRRTQP